MTEPLLVISDLRVSFFMGAEERRAVDGASFELHAGRTLALVGESGCGKTVTALALLGLVDAPGRITGGSIRYDGIELAGAPEATLERLRGDRIAMVFQEPMSALNPVMRIGEQVAEPLLLHHGASRAEARGRALALLAEVGLPSPEERYDDYPHELSGGMRQRVMIAMALACEPKLIIADEPTTALDVTIQAQILALLRRLQAKHGTALLFITHDLGLLPRIADDVAVMYAGRIVERGTMARVLSAPRHPYARALLDSLPRGKPRGQRLRSIPGTVPEPGARRGGCAFAERCGFARERCSSEVPVLAEDVACFYPQEART
jgi:peptide/nickel transport system ATP-binding protein